MPILKFEHATKCGIYEFKGRTYDINDAIESICSKFKKTHFDFFYGASKASADTILCYIAQLREQIQNKEITEQAATLCLFKIIFDLGESERNPDGIRSTGWYREESLWMTLADVMLRELTDYFRERPVPPDAPEDFILGIINPTRYNEAYGQAFSVNRFRAYTMPIPQGFFVIGAQRILRGYIGKCIDGLAKKDNINLVEILKSLDFPASLGSYDRPGDIELVEIPKLTKLG